MTYKLKVDDRLYTTWSVYHSSSLILADVSINPIQHKLFDQDIFSLLDGERVKTEHSCVRTMKMIPGVLVLVGNKTFGKWKRDRYLFKCIPDDRRLPIFLVPYKQKYGFSKKLKNKYVTFKFENWNNKHPQGSIVQTIGDVEQLSCFYEYQLYCKSLYASIQKFTKDTMRALKKRSEEEYITMILKQYKIEDRREMSVYTIDPGTSKDFDDGFGLVSLGDSRWKLTIYISNVSLWLDIMDLWTSFSQRIATIYLPDRKRPMLPTILSDALCSLQENRIRFAFAMDIIVDNNNIESVSYCNTCISVKKNFAYDSSELERNSDYMLLLKLVKGMNNAKKYIDHIRDSHDVVAYLMVMMNFLSAQKLREHKCGIYRAVTLKPTADMPEGVPENVKKFLKGWMSSGGRYVNYDNITEHQLLDLEAYIHITSPIRRLVDLLNIMTLQDKLGLCAYSERSKVFHEKWGKSLEYINTTMRAIRKVQNDCSLLNMVTDKQQLLNADYDGFIFESIERNDGLYQYLVYLPQLNMTNRITLRHRLDNMTTHQFKIFIFVDEDRLKQKIRLEYISK